jgi:TPR repeat protein
MKYTAAIALLSLALPLSAFGARPEHDWDRELQSAQALLAKGDYAAAYPRFERIAAHNPLAQFTLALFHQNGWGRPKNPVAACTWFEKAAQKQVPAAEHYLGDCLAEGIGRPANIPQALAWYDKAASHGHLISLCSEAEYYIRGKGVDKDVEKGMALCTGAAQANSPPAMIKLAHYYQGDKDVPQNLAAARYWYWEAAQRNVDEAQLRLGAMLANGEGGAIDLDAARQWLETAAADGYAPAYLPTAVLYANAPVQKETGALAPEHLAKIYLWTEAAKARGSTPELVASAEKLEAQVLKVMPASWRPKLDQQVAEHLAQHPN